MKTNTLAWAMATLAVLILLIMTSVSHSPGAEQIAADQQTQENLALREIADRLLKENRDLFSPIPPIRKEGKDAYLIKLETKVNYFKLKSIIDTTLERHQIQPDYRLSLLDCTSGEITLGFLAKAEDEEGEFPCQEREQTGDCYNIKLSLISSPIAFSPTTPTGLGDKMRWLLFSLVIGLPIAAWWTWQQNPKPVILANNEINGWQQKTKQTLFHPSNQSLKVDEQVISLTFREAKLLNFFFEHANQVLERDKILQSVWEDEGIIVGRSLDVFVSRLRKKIKQDPDLSIVNVHGVGYRLEVLEG